MKMKLNLTILFLVTIVLNSCNIQSKPKSFDYGRVENNKYVNSYFSFEMNVPSQWIVQTKEQMENIANEGKNLVAGDDAKMKAALNAADVNSANLLSVFQYERGAAVEYNPSIALVAENIKNFPGIKNGSDYLFQVRKLLEQSQLKYDNLDKEFLKEVINGIDFYKMNAEIQYGGLDIKQVYYSTISNGFSFNAIISFVNDEQKEVLLNCINSMKFNKN
jgi:hypothetical protein